MCWCLALCLAHIWHSKPHDIEHCGGGNGNDKREKAHSYLFLLLRQPCSHAQAPVLPSPRCPSQSSVWVIVYRWTRCWSQQESWRPADSADVTSLRSCLLSPCRERSAVPAGGTLPICRAVCGAGTTEAHHCQTPPPDNTSRGSSPVRTCTKEPVRQVWERNQSNQPGVSVFVFCVFFLQGVGWLGSSAVRWHRQCSHLPSIYGYSFVFSQVWPECTSGSLPTDDEMWIQRPHLGSLTLTQMLWVLVWPTFLAIKTQRKEDTERWNHLPLLFPSCWCLVSIQGEAVILTVTSIIIPFLAGSFAKPVDLGQAVQNVSKPIMARTTLVPLPTCEKTSARKSWRTLTPLEMNELIRLVGLSREEKYLQSPSYPWIDICEGSMPGSVCVKLCPNTL